MKSRIFAWTLLSILTIAAASLPAANVSVDLTLLPPDAQTNRLDAALTVTTPLGTKSDSDTAAVTGNIQANLSLSIDPLTHAADANSLQFTGGLIHLSDMSFTLNYGTFIGKIEARSSSLAGTPSSPAGPGPVAAETFNTIDHAVLLNQGTITASGTGLLANLFEPLTMDLAAEPMQATADAVGTLTVRLESLDALSAVYRVNLTLPMAYDELTPINESVTAAITGGGTIRATGTFTLPACPLRADLTGDCIVDLYDLVEFANQWLATSEQTPCPLTADLAGQDCHIDLHDLASLATEWLQQQY